MTSALGLIALALPNVSSHLIQRKGGLPESIADGFSGLVHGGAIATTLLGLTVRMRSRR